MHRISSTGSYITADPNDHCFDPQLAEGLAAFLAAEGRSVVDLGCGTGAYARRLRKAGLEVECYDGNPHTRELSCGLCDVLDFSRQVSLGRTFDWVLSLEVGEHIPQIHEHNFIDVLHSHNRSGIVLSWAIPGQGGGGHVNERDNWHIKQQLQMLGYVPDATAQQTLRDSACAAHWFKNTIMVFRRKSTITESRRRQVFDGFIFFNELDLLEIRLAELSPVVDRFVLVEAETTFSGKSKPLYFELNKHRYAEYADKIEHIILRERDFDKRWLDPWGREHQQRNAIALGFAAASDDDIVMISDADEIPRPEAVRSYHPMMGMAKFCQVFSYYYLNVWAGDGTLNQASSWCGTLATTPATLSSRFGSASAARLTSPDNLLWNGGWHFSYLGGIEAIQKKIESFAHTELDTASNKQPDHLRWAIDNHMDLYGRSGHRWTPVAVDSLFPAVVRDKYRDNPTLVMPPSHPDELTRLASMRPNPFARREVTALLDGMLNQRRSLDRRVLLLGFHDPNAVMAWRDYFPNATIYLIACDANAYAGERRIVSAGPSWAPQDLVGHLMNIGGLFEFICDDTEDAGSDRQSRLAKVFGLLRPGGLYLQTDGQIQPPDGGIAEASESSPCQMMTDIEMLASLPPVAFGQNHQEGCLDVSTMQGVVDWWHRRRYLILKRN